MRKVMLAIAAALIMAPVAGSAQTAAENFSYREPSGMFGEGHAKWQMYKFMHEDRERTERLQHDLATGSIGADGTRAASTTSDRQVPRPRERRLRGAR